MKQQTIEIHTENTRLETIFVTNSMFQAQCSNYITEESNITEQNDEQFDIE